MHARRDGVKTRQKLISAAESVFGSRGYHKATHTEIGGLAGVNAALINFHFGGKEGLYRAVWEALNDAAAVLCPVDGGLPSETPAEVRLHAHVRAALVCAIHPRLADFHRIHMYEMVNPSGLLDSQMAEHQQRNREHMRGLLAELLGPAVSPERVDLCELSVISQFRMIRPKCGNRGPAWHRVFDLPDCDMLADHITRFSLAGIEAMRRHFENIQGTERTIG